MEYKERPIIMTGDSVRAILGGRKTQTRRVIKPQPTAVDEMYGPNKYWLKMDTYTITEHHCPYGRVGDRLWVRETWHHAGPERTPGYVSYRADGEFMEYYKKQGYKWRPSIFMPRWASRLTLEVVSVRVERVQEISSKDAIAEGVEYDVSKPGGWPVDRFAFLWDKINGKRGYSWDSNPFVWVIEFCKV